MCVCTRETAGERERVDEREREREGGRQRVCVYETETDRERQKQKQRELFCCPVLGRMFATLLLLFLFVCLSGLSGFCFVLLLLLFCVCFVIASVCCTKAILLAQNKVGDG